MIQGSCVEAVQKRQNRFCTPCEIVSIGDNIDEGFYTIHSRFHKAVNFVKQHEIENDTVLKPSEIFSDKVVSLVNEEIGAGPTNLVVQNLNSHTVCSILITKQSVCINNYPIGIDTSRRYVSTLHFIGIDLEKFENRFDRFESFLLQLASPKSLAFLLNEERKRGFRPGFERAVAEKVQRGVQKIFSGNLSDGVRMIKGLGFGLTPSGDDFLSGLLLGLFIIQNVYGKALSAAREQVYDLALGKNLISNTFLYCAKEGLLFERWKFLIRSLLYAGENELYDATQRLLSVGETSGADAAVGFLLTLRRFV